MDRDRLNLLFLSQFPPGPPTFGRKRRVQGLMSALARRHEITGISLITAEYDRRAAEDAMRVLQRGGAGPARSWEGAGKRLQQARSLVSKRSFVRSLWDLPALRKALDERLSARSYDIVNVELSIPRPSAARAGAPGARRRGSSSTSTTSSSTWRGSRRRTSRSRAPGVQLDRLAQASPEEIEIWTRFDGVAFCSAADEARAASWCPPSDRQWFPMRWTWSTSSRARPIRLRRPHGDLLRRHQLLSQRRRAPLPAAGSVALDREEPPASAPEDRGAAADAGDPRFRPRIEVAGRSTTCARICQRGGLRRPIAHRGGTRFKDPRGDVDGEAVVSTSLGAEASRPNPAATSFSPTMPAPSPRRSGASSTSPVSAAAWD